MLDTKLKKTRISSMAYRTVRQRGIYALEFALVFPFLFILFYGVLSVGIIFTAQHSLTLAAEDGARAALRYGAGASSMAQLQVRVAHGCDIAANRTSWLAKMGVGDAAASCQAQITGPCAQADGSPGAGTCTANFTDGGTPTAISCGSLANQQCEATLIVAYAYRDHPLIPLVPLANFIVPASITGLATVVLDPATLQLSGGA